MIHNQGPRGKMGRHHEKGKHRGQWSSIMAAANQPPLLNVGRWAGIHKTPVKYEWEVQIGFPVLKHPLFCGCRYHHLYVRLEQDTVWLTQQQIAMLMGTNVPAISKHITNIWSLF